MIRSTYLENLRAKPEPARRRIAVLVSLALTAIVVIVWFINMSVTINSPVVGESSPDLSLFDHIKRIGTGFTVVLESLRNLLP